MILRFILWSWNTLYIGEEISSLIGFLECGWPQVAGLVRFLFAWPFVFWMVGFCNSMFWPFFCFPSGSLLYIPCVLLGTFGPFLINILLFIEKKMILRFI